LEGLALFVVFVLPVVILIWAVLLGLFIYAIRLAATGRRVTAYLLGGVVTLVAAAILLRPEADDVLRAFRARQVASMTTSTPSSQPPYHLNIVGAGSDDDVVLALAESGLFDVTTSWRGHEGRYDKRIVVEDAGDCMKRRTQHVYFTAATGFTRCGRSVQESGTLPANRLTLWIGGPPLMPASLRQKTQGGLQLSEIDGDKESLLAYWETSLPLGRSFVARLLPYGVREHDSRVPHSMRTSYKTFDPDVLKFVFDGVRIDPDGIAVPGRKSPRDLAGMISNILAQGPTQDADTVIPALSMLGAMGTHSAEADVTVNEIAKHMFVDRYRSLMQIDDSLDCQPADIIVSHRQAASQACSDRARLGDKESRKVSCTIPVSKEEYRELCRSGFRDEVWSDHGTAETKVLIAWPKPGYKSNIAIGRWNGGDPSITIVDVPGNHGQLDLALVSQGSHLWYFTGSTECVARVSVTSPESGVVGIPPDRVHFRFRWETNVGPSSWNKTPLEFPGIADMLGAKPDLTLTRVESELSLGQALATARNASTGCREPHQTTRPDVQNESIAVDPEEVVTDPIMIPFKVR